MKNLVALTLMIASTISTQFAFAGSYPVLTFKEAQNFCQSTGEHLPSALEFAKTFNPNGIGYKGQGPSYRIHSSTENFNYGPATYSRPDGLPPQWFWTSSQLATDSSKAYLFGVVNGDLTPWNIELDLLFIFKNTTKAYVLCFPSE